MSREHLSISAIRSSNRGGVSRVFADVDGSELWFESADIALRASCEAFVSSFLIPAAVLGRQLVAADAVAADFAANLPRVLDITARWWEYARLLPKLDTVAAGTRQRGTHHARQMSPGTALCFSGGVDSFYSLLEAGHQVDALVFVHGFDVKLDDTERATAIQQHLRAVAREVGARPVCIRTNLREHPTFRATPWIHTHGGALAAAGHLLSDAWGTLLISASYSFADHKTWGSHWELDPHWSGAGLRVEHVGAQHRRTEKIAALKDHPLVHRYLRVCWENRSHRLNCSRCEKCIRNQVLLAGFGTLDSFEVFEPSSTLSERVDAVECIRIEGLFQRYERALELGLPYDVDAAVRRLLSRSRRALLHRRIDHARSYAAAVMRRLLHLGRTDSPATAGGS
ncbi:MAG TPA: hypothetical protein VFK04_09625 [Gemmatimonadaceae bacterium]|nr:hypothetical protein [Gemmatimonadaceae bacterium]